jgi:imidazolonepropionase-like amidohydrolase
MSTRTLATLTRLAGLVLLGSAASAQTIAIKAGRIITRAGPDVEDGVILIVDGKIEAIGKEVEIPWDAEVLDAGEHVAFPGLVESQAVRGMDRPNENVDVAPYLDVRDSLDPVNFYFEDALRQGVTTINVQQGPATVIGGQGRIVRPIGMTVEEMTVRPAAGMKLSAKPKPGKSRVTQAQTLRRAFDDLRRHLLDLVQQKEDGNDQARREALFQGRDFEKPENKEGKPFKSAATWKVEGFEAVPRGEVDEKMEPLLRLVEGRIPAFVHCDEPMDVHLALEVASENGFLHRTVLVLESECWKAADVIAERGVPVILLPSLVHRERDPLTGEELETFVPGVFDEKGVRYAFGGAGDSSEGLLFQAAFAVGRGLEREKALAAVTSAPAALIGLGDRVGTLEKGKDGNVVLLTGDPLSITSLVDWVVIDGTLAYDRSKDVRQQHLLQGVRPPNTAPAEPEGEAEAGDEPEQESGEEQGEDEKSDEDEG